MSHALRDLVRDRCPDISGNTRLVLLELAFRADQDNKCWPSVALLAYDSAVSFRSVGDALKALARLGVISIESGKGKGSSIYTLNVELIDSMVKVNMRDLHISEEVNVQNSHINMQDPHIKYAKNVSKYAKSAYGITQEDSQLTTQGITQEPPREGAHARSGALQSEQSEEQSEERESRTRSSQGIKIDPEAVQTRSQPVKSLSSEGITDLRAMLTLRANEELAESGYPNFEAFWSEFWSNYPKKGRVDKKDCEGWARENIPPKLWKRVRKAEGNYLLSSIVLRGMARNAINFLTGETWMVYEDEPIIDQPQQQQPQKSAADQKATNMIGRVNQAATMLEDIRKGRMNGSTRPVEELHQPSSVRRLTSGQ